MERMFNFFLMAMTAMKFHKVTVTALEMAAPKTPNVGMSTAQSKMFIKLVKRMMRW